MRAQGSIYRRPRSPFWWIRYSYRGSTYRESTKEKSRARAGEYLDRRLAEIGADVLGLRKFVGPAADRIQVGQMFAALRSDLELRGLRSLAATANHLSHAAAAWGGWLLKETTSERIDLWISQQVSEGRLSPATLNRRLQLLRQALTLAVDRGLLAVAPKVRKLSELGHERTGFFEHAEFEAVVSHLPDYLQDFCRFAYLTGWRKGAIASLMWADVDMDARVIRLRPEHDKAGSGQVLPLEGELWKIIERRDPARFCRGTHWLCWSSTAMASLYETSRRVGEQRAALQVLRASCSTTSAGRRYGTLSALASLSGWRCRSAATRRARLLTGIASSRLTKCKTRSNA